MLATAGAILIVSDSGNDSLRKFELGSRTVSTVAGQQSSQFGWVGAAVIRARGAVVVSDTEVGLVLDVPVPGVRPTTIIGYEW